MMQKAILEILMAMQSNQIVLDKLPVSNYIVSTLTNGKHMVELVDLQVRFRLSKSMAKIVKLMYDDGRITGDAIENEHKIVTDAKVIMHKIRRRLAPFGITIHSRRDVGYWVDDASRDALLLALGNEAPAGHAGEGEHRSNEAPPDEDDHTP